MRTTANFSHEVNEIMGSLEDDISRDLFHARWKNLIYRNFDDYRNDILCIYEKYGLKWEIFQLDSEVEKHPNVPGLVIFGTGVNGKQTLRLIRNSKHKELEVLFCDNNSALWESSVEGCKVISPRELLAKYSAYICIIGSFLYRQVIFEQLIFEGFPKENILYPNLGLLYGFSGWQYFDYFAPLDWNGKGETFVDGGVFDGTTAGDFSKWCKGKYKKIFGFEASPQNIDQCLNYYKTLNNAEIISKGLWSGSGVLSFSCNEVRASSRMSENGTNQIEVDSIDNVLMGEEATFIKMDIEGSEYQALLGAEKTIKKFRPRMAISIYHKPEDIFEIPALIHEFDPSYKFAIRQYSSIGDETILYAF